MISEVGFLPYHFEQPLLTVELHFAVEKRPLDRIVTEIQISPFPAAQGINE